MSDLTREQIEAWRKWGHSKRALEARAGFDALCDMALRLAQAEREREGLKVLDHKWLDPKCIEEGCQSLVLKGIYESAVKGRQDFRAAFRDAKARVEQLEAQLRSARAAIASAPDDTWGTNAEGDFDTPGASRSWPIKDELLHYIDEALASPRAAAREADREMTETPKPQP